MTKGGARTAAVIGVGLTTVATTVAHVTGQENTRFPPRTVLIGAFILLIFLFILTEWSADLAGALAVLILLSGLIANGEALGKSLATSINQAKTTTPGGGSGKPPLKQ